MNILQRYHRLSFWNKLAVWGSLAGLAGIIFSVAVYFGGVFGNSPTPTSLQNTLQEYLKELEGIESNWNVEFRKVEEVAGRTAAVLENSFPQYSKHIRDTLTRSLESKELLRLLRQDIKEVQDQLMIEDGHN